MLIHDNSVVRKNYFDSNIIQNENARTLQSFSKNYFEADIEKKGTCLQVTHQGAKPACCGVSSMMHHKFSYNAVSCILWENHSSHVSIHITLKFKKKLDSLPNSHSCPKRSYLVLQCNIESKRCR